MSRKPLSQIEAAAWQRVIATVKPLRVPKATRPAPTVPHLAAGSSGRSDSNANRAMIPGTEADNRSGNMRFINPRNSHSADAQAFADALEGRVRPAAKPPALGINPQHHNPYSGAQHPANTPRQPPAHPSDRGLDGHWDRRLGKGSVAPDVTIDLHGHNLASAYSWLDQSLMLAIASGHRIILLITGKPRPHEDRINTGRGAIRAAVTDWLAASRHAGNIAAVRNAHPRHGGQGALYVVLRRRG